MADSINFQPYLESICHHYLEWRTLYTMTDIEGKKVDSSNKRNQGTPFDFGLLVQPVKKEPDASRQEKTEKLERRPVLEGLHKSLAEAKHVLLIGRPGSGKSTTLARLLLEEAEKSQTAFASVTTSQRQQHLEEKQCSLQEEYSLRHKKLGQLRKANAIETGVAIQFQLKQQIQDEEAALEALNTKLTSIEQALGKASVSPQIASQANTQETYRIPVLVELRYFKTSVLELIQAFFRRHNLVLETHQVEALLSDNHLLLLIDGLNELSSEAARQEIVRLRDYRNLPMVFTTRDLSLGGNFGIEKQWEMLPLTEPQMQMFIRSHLSEDQAGSMWRQLEESSRKFAETPLLLWMLCELFTAGEAVPHNLSETFRIFTRAYENSSIRKYEVAALKGDVQSLSDRRLWFPALKHLAYIMMQGETSASSRTVIPREEAEQKLKALFSDEPYFAKAARNCLDDLLNYHLLQIGSGNEIEFRHQLLQEYYASEYLLQKLLEFSDSQLKFYFFNYLKWTEVIFLMLGLLNDSTQAVRLTELALEVDLMLGAKLAGAVKLEVQSYTVSLLSKLKVPPLLKIDLLGNTHSEQAVLELQDALVHPSQDYQERSIDALEKVGGKSATNKLIELFLENPNSFLSKKAAQALIRMGNDAWILTLKKKIEDEKISKQANTFSFVKLQEQVSNLEEVNKLLEDLENKDHNVRQTAVDNLGIIGDKKILSNLLKAARDKNSGVRWRATEALGKLGGDEVILDLINLLESQDNFVRESASYWLGKSDNALAVSSLIKALEDEDVGVRWNACYSLGRSANELAIPALIKRLEDQESCIRWQATEALGEIGSKAAVPELFKLLQSRNTDIREKAAYLLGMLGSKLAMPELIKAIKNEDSFIRARAAEAIQNLIDDNDVLALITGIENRNSNVRSNFVNTIAKILIESGDITTELINFLEDPDPLVRWSAVEELAKFNDKDIVPELLKMLSDQSSLVCWSVIEILGKIGDKAAIPSLIHLLDNSDPSARWRIIEALGHIGGEDAVAVLIEALSEDKDSFVRWRASNSLGEIRAKEAVQNLLKALEDESDFVRWSAVEALERTGSIPAQDLIKNLAHKDTRICEKIAEIIGKVCEPNIVSTLWQLNLEEPKMALLSSIASIQSRYKFYNYDIAQSPPPPAVNSQEQGIGGQGQTNNFTIGTLNTSHSAISLGGTIQGDQIGNQSYKPEP